MYAPFRAYLGACGIIPSLFTKKKPNMAQQTIWEICVLGLILLSELP